MTTALLDETTSPTERTSWPWPRSCGPQLDENAGRHDQDGSWVRDSFEHLRDSGVLALGVPARTRWARRDHQRPRCGATRTGQALRIDGARVEHAPARDGVHGVALASGVARRRSDPATDQRRGHRAGVDRWCRFHPSARFGGSDRWRLSRDRTQGLRQPVARRHRHVDDVHLRRPGTWTAGVEHGRSARRRPASRWSRRGMRWACAVRRATTSS